MVVEGWIDRTRGGRWIAWGLAVLVAIVLLSVIDLGVRAALAHLVVVTGEAEWIWDEGVPAGRDGVDAAADPAAFYALDVFELGQVPAAAELEIRADEEYLVWLNGVFLGGAAYDAAPRGSVDVYDVAAILTRGENWIVVEARSQRAVGGLLCRLRAGTRTLSATGGHWRIEQRYVREALRSDDETAIRGAPPHIWSTPPVGRWGYARANRRMASPGERFADPRQPLVAQSWSRRDTRSWKPVRPAQQLTRAHGPWVTFDWGGVVEGHLALNRIVRDRAGETAPPRALVLYGLEPPDARRLAAEDRPADEVALFVPDSPGWVSARPSRFRYVTVLGLDEIGSAAVYELAGGEPAAAHERPRGVFGFEPPALRSSVEHEVRSELEDVLGVAAR